MNSAPMNFVRLDVALDKPVPSKKNRYNPTPDGRRLLMDKKLRPRIKTIENALVYALLSAFQTTAKGMQTACSLRSWIAFCLPEDDCWQCLPDVSINVYLTPGQSSLTIEITEIL